MGVHERLGKESGFTMNELLVVTGILCLLAGFAIPAFSQWLPDYRLKAAARELYANLQLTKMGAIKENRRWRIVFFPNTNRYVVWSYGPNGEWDGGTGDDVDMKSVDLSEYGKGICFGEGAATHSATETPGTIPEDGVSYNYNIAVFSTRGTANTLGYVYICNEKRTCFAVGTLNLAGGIIIKRWSKEGWE